MDLIVQGLSHHQTPESVRQNYIISQKLLDCFFQSLEGNASLILLSTCNRLEMYTADMSENESLEYWKKLLIFAGCPIVEPAYCLKGEEAVKHALRVSLGLESRILKEHQILGQMRKAYHLSDRYCRLSYSLRKVFEHCFRISKKMRSTWQKASLGQMACKMLAKKKLSSDVLIIGAGEIVQDFLSHSHYLENCNFYLCNRTHTRALELAKKHTNPITVIPFNELHLWVKKIPNIIIGISLDRPLFDHSYFNPNIAYEILDFGIPSALSPEVKHFDHIKVRSLDSFHNNPLDYEEKRAIEKRIQEEARLFAEEIYIYENSKPLSQYRTLMIQECQKITQQALSEYHRGKSPEQLIEEVAYRIQQKLLHAPSVAFRKSMIKSHHVDSFCDYLNAIPLSPTKSFESV